MKTVFSYIILGFLLLSFKVDAQEISIQQMGRRMGQMGQRLSGGMGQTKDSLRHRNMNEDSITISYRYLDLSGSFKLDSSVDDFTKRFPQSATAVNLGNFGTASRSLVFNPIIKAGFDEGSHSFDSYKWTIEDARLFNTTRPYSEMNYMLGSKSEQMISLLHTQNVKPNLNFSFQYRSINAPGFYQHQHTNHNNYLFTTRYQSKNMRYHGYFILLSNRMQSEENGGIVDTTNIMDDPAFKDRNNIPTYLGGAASFNTGFFRSSVSTANKQNESSFLIRQQYDLGRKDSLVTDSTVIPLFYPRLRFEHQLQIDKRAYVFFDNVAPSSYYSLHYDTSFSQSIDTIYLQDKWNSVSNDFSIYQFPDANNLQQYFKVGMYTQLLNGQTKQGNFHFFNTAGHAAYRNRSKNQKWDIDANGILYFTGINAGDYLGHISLKGVWGKRKGSLELGFENSNRTTSFMMDSRSSFYLSHSASNLKKENSTHIFGTLKIPTLKIELSGHYYLLANYTYLKNYYEFTQASSAFNVITGSLYKKINITKHLIWHAELYAQQAIGTSPLNLLPVYTRNRLAYEGSLGFKNLSIAMGTEIRYRLSYKADAYSPLLAQYLPQQSKSITNKLPDIAGYIHFRIRPFTAYFRAENLNSVRDMNGIGFTNNNLVSAGYPLPGLQIRLGVFWQFVN